MAKIGIELNEVLRDMLAQFEYTYNKYKPLPDVTIDLENNPVTEYDLLKHFPFSGGTDEMNMFLFEEAALEIFGHADEMHTNLMNKFNLFLMDIKDDEEHEIWLISREAVNSIPATFFFLSKTGARLENIHFVQKFEDEWKHVDVLIAASPRVLACKPEGKISVKVNCTYNKNAPSDYEINNFSEFMDNHELRNKILKTK